MCSYLSSTPRSTVVGSHQTAGSSPAPRGISPLAWFSRNRPHCLRRITSSEQTSLVRFRLKAKSSLVPLLLLFPQSLSTLWEPFTMLQRSDVRLDGSIAPLLVMAVPGAARYWQPAVSRSLLGRTNQRPTISFFGGVSLFSPGRSPRSRYLGFGFRQNSGNVLDEWVCNFQGAVRP